MPLYNELITLRTALPGVDNPLFAFANAELVPDPASYSLLNIGGERVFGPFLWAGGAQRGWEFVQTATATTFRLTFSGNPNYPDLYSGPGGTVPAQGAPVAEDTVIPVDWPVVFEQVDNFSGLTDENFATGENYSKVSGYINRGHDTRAIGAIMDDEQRVTFSINLARGNVAANRYNARLSTGVHLPVGTQAFRITMYGASYLGIIKTWCNYQDSGVGSDTVLIDSDTSELVPTAFRNFFMRYRVMDVGDTITDNEGLVWTVKRVDVVGRRRTLSVSCERVAI